jgi:hypothetical protein
VLSNWGIKVAMIFDLLSLPTDLDNVCRDTCALVHGNEEECHVAGKIQAQLHKSYQTCFFAYRKKFIIGGMFVIGVISTNN